MDGKQALPDVERGLAHFLEISGIEKENEDMPLFPTPLSNYIYIEKIVQRTTMCSVFPIINILQYDGTFVSINKTILTILT